MRRIKRWLFGRFLPFWCRDELMAENDRLRAQVAHWKQECAYLHNYINGMERALRLTRVRTQVQTNKEQTE